jgi:hypothetical protein
MTGLVLTLVLTGTPITLEQARQEARNNLQALLTELDRVRSSEQKRIALSPILPQLSVNTSASRTWTQSGDPSSCPTGRSTSARPAQRTTSPSAPRSPS